jgi:hypothetical protein
VNAGDGCLTRFNYVGINSLSSIISIILLKVKSSKCHVVASCSFLRVRNSHINQRKKEKSRISILHSVLDGLDLIQLN